MWPKAHLFPAFTFLFALIVQALPAAAAGISGMECERSADSRTHCRIAIEGEVQAGDRLFLPASLDSDELFFAEKPLGAYRFPFSAPFLPRLYSLGPLAGQANPLLTLEGKAFFPGQKIDFAKSRIIPPDFPLHRIYSPLAAKLISFALLLAFSLFTVCCVRRTTLDGWTYPEDELRWFFGSLCGYLILETDLSHALVPWFWSARLHLFTQSLSLSICLWCVSALLLQVRFNDRYCVERGLYRRPSRAFAAFSDIAFFLSLLSLLPPWQATARAVIAFHALPLLASLVASARALEWKRVLKRSSASPLLFHFSLLGIASVAFLTAPLVSGHQAVSFMAWACLGLGAWRMHRYFQAQKRGHALVKECRESLARFARGEARLRALCDFIEDEWAAARASVISVQQDLGLVLASSGPDAIPDLHLSRPRRLGPFLRRVCRAGHILYAPVAEELGKDLQEQGLKHSSLAIPFHQEGKVRSVVCMMADEGERIPPIEATVLELFCAELALEILSACAQHVAEKKCEKLYAIASQADGVAVEHIDGWGELRYSDKEEERFLVGASLELMVDVPGSGALKKVAAEFQRELRAVWHALAIAYEFVPREIKEDFWVLSPKDFRQPFLRELGPERVALLLSLALDRHARALAAKECYLLLSQPVIRVASGLAKLQLVSYGAQETAALEVDAQDLERLKKLRRRAGVSGPACFSLPPPLAGFALRALSLPREENRDSHSILAVFTDKKEKRKIETKALEIARDSLRKAA